MIGSGASGPGKVEGAVTAKECVLVVAEMYSNKYGPCFWCRDSAQEHDADELE